MILKGLKINMVDNKTKNLVDHDFLINIKFLKSNIFFERFLLPYIELKFFPKSFNDS